MRADGELLVCEPAEVLPMAQRYFLLFLRRAGAEPSQRLLVLAGVATREIEDAEAMSNVRSLSATAAHPTDLDAEAKVDKVAAAVTWAWRTPLFCI